jgi:hypothetical protein
MAREKEFIDKYVAAFLGAVAAQNYLDCRFPPQPIEDAYFLARQAWDKIAKL